MLREYFFKLSLQIVYISLRSWSKNAKLDRKIIFCKTCVGFVENLCHLVQPVQLFLDQGFLIKGQLFSPKPRSGVGFCREKNSKNYDRNGKNCSHLIQPVLLFESTKFRDYWSTLTSYISWLFFLTWEITGTQVLYPSKTPKNKMKKVRLSPRT